VRRLQHLGRDRPHEEQPILTSLWHPETAATTGGTFKQPEERMRRTVWAGVATTAILVLSPAAAHASTQIGSGGIRDNSIRSVDIRDHTIRLVDIRESAQDHLRGQRGPAGPAGADGKDGAPGPAGPPGADGADGTDGTDGKDGATGIVGLDHNSVAADVAPGTTNTVEVHCPAADAVATGGGFSVDGLNPDLQILQTRNTIDGTGWLASAFNHGTTAVAVRAWVVCATAAPATP
jgi:hypothetical protein